MFKQDTYQILKVVKNECNKRSKKTISYRFFKNDRYEEYKLHLEKLSDSRYIEILKKFCVDHELWIIKVKPKGHVYIKCYESVGPHQEKYYIETRSERKSLFPSAHGGLGAGSPQ